MYYIACRNREDSYSIEEIVENWHDTIDGFEPIDCIKGEVIIYDEKGHKYLVGPEKDLKEEKLFWKISTVDVGSWDFDNGEPFLIDTNIVALDELSELLKDYEKSKDKSNDI